MAENLSANMSGISLQGGLQVVKASEEPGRRWELDEEALASVLLRPDIRNLPVVVVSVGGPYRGGRSFILNFFLRYLMAPKKHQSNGQWLGKDDDLLEGFNWRGGAECVTKGICLWPEPIVVNMEETGGKVAVLLMDTQGTFDTESDMGDNSSIFALSVLLSSTQIYNLRNNIREDDLQPLQLFTEYSKIATELEGKAFQTLLFLVRDWCDPFDHSYGYIGGKELLERRLTPRPNQNEQLFDVRIHIYSCFEKLDCFLMPHPGRCAFSRQFMGRLSDIDEEFKSSLLELVPALFNQNNLIPKTINGEHVQAQGLFEYFKQYVGIFNEMPAATTIFQATADVALTLALREACQCYESVMKTKIIEGQSVLTSMIQTWHSSALETATAYFYSRDRLNTNQIQIENNLAELKKTSETWLLMYQLQNNEKLRNAFSEAQKVYDDTVGVVCVDQAFICLHVLDLEALHNRALIEALNSFDLTRKAVPVEQDTDRNDFIQKLEQNYQYLCLTNKRNNSSALLEARMVYLTCMIDKGKKQDHEHSMTTAVEHFLSQRNQPTEATEDQFLDQLRQDIEDCFKEFKQVNARRTLFAMNEAENAYQGYVGSAMGPHCFHPRALWELHNEALAHSLEQFHKDRIETDENDYKDRLIAKIERRFEELKRINDHKNFNAVDLAYNEYKRMMDQHAHPLFGAPRFIFVNLEEHKSAENHALSVFNEKRRGSSYPNDDPHLANLKLKIDQAYSDYYTSSHISRMNQCNIV